MRGASPHTLSVSANSAHSADETGRWADSKDAVYGPEAQLGA